MRYTRAQIEEAMQRLTVLERTVVMLRLFDDMTPAEIAQVVDVAEENVDRLYSKAMASITATLNHCFTG